MQLSTITIENFRCFKNISLDLHPQLTVLVAPNGGGKTTVLDALRVSLWPFVKGFDLGSQTGKSATIQIEDVRMEKKENGNMEPVTPTKILTYGKWHPDRSKQYWQQSREKLKPRTNTIYDSVARKLTQYSRSIEQQIRDVRNGESPIDLPLIAYLGTGRLWYQGRYYSFAKEKKLQQGVFSRTWAYRDCISASSGYKQFEDWYSWVFRTWREHQIIQLEKGGDIPSEANIFRDAISAIKKAVDEVIKYDTGWGDIAYSSSYAQQIVLRHDHHGDLPLSSLSDGIRNTVSLVADLAFRAIKLNPHFGAEAAVRTRGTVLIDEIDMFLHPAWQQRIIGAFLRAFPNLQFVVTTHSPQVLTTVDKNCIRLLHQRIDEEENLIYEAIIPGTQTRGTANSDVMAHVMGSDPVPNVKEAVWLSEYKKLIQTRKHLSNEAQALRERLDQHFGRNHQEILECDRLIRLEKMRKTINSNKTKKG